MDEIILPPQPAQVVQADSLRVLAERINGTHQAVARSLTHSALLMRECGMALLRALAQVERGKFGAWIEANTNLSRTTAYRYMKFAKDAGLAARVENALEAVVPEADDEEPPEPAPVPAKPKKPSPGGTVHAEAPEVKEEPAREPASQDLEDGNGVVIPRRCRGTFYAALRLWEMAEEALKLAEELKELHKGPYPVPAVPLAVSQLENVRGTLSHGRRTLVCPACLGEEKRCVTCDDLGLVSLALYDSYKRNNPSFVPR